MSPTIREASAHSSTPPEDLPRPFQCATCKRAFTRVDHLTRHARAHTRQKPYICPVCEKGFSRVDLLKRHTANHTTNNGNGRQKREAVHPSRVAQACEACSQNHLRCEDKKPCKRCRKKNIPCEIPAGEEIHAVAGQNHLEFSDSIDDSLPASTVVDESVPLNEVQQPSSHDPEPQSLYPGPILSSGDGGSPFRDEDSFLADYLRNVPPFEACLSGTATPRGIMDWNFDWDIDLNNMDICFLDNNDEQIPSNAHPLADIQCSQQEPVPDLSNEGLAKRHEAFQKSVWRFLPQPSRDFGAAEQPNLAYIDVATDNPSRHSRIPLQPAIPSRLDRIGRDKLMALVLGTCQPANIGRVASAFPVTEILDGLLQYFFTSPVCDAKTLFHIPTFDASKIPPILLASIVAAGAVAMPDVPLRKLGFALQESARLGQARIYEEDNSSIRDLQYHRTMILQLEIGMWSGMSRKMEISESFLQPLVTMIRRGGSFRRSMYKDYYIEEQENGSVLEEKWTEWIRQESYLRVIYRVIEHDTQSSMALLKPPLISYSEMQLPLPHPDTLWFANSANSWKSAYLTSIQSFSNRPSPTDCFISLDHLEYHRIAPAVYLHMIWRMIWEYRQLASLSGKSPALQTGGLILTSRQLELTKYLEDFWIHLTGTTKENMSRKGVQIQLELMHVHLNAPIDDIQTFAGIEGQEEARRAWPTLQTWVDTPSARQALWRAGQVFRAIRSLPKNMLCNFNATAAYHAGLVLWGYGLLKRSPVREASERSEEPEVLLDGEESLEVQRFIKLGRGKPALEIQQPRFHTIQISDVTSVMDSVIQILKDNHDSPKVRCPPLVENLLQLIEGLKSAKRNNGS